MGTGTKILLLGAVGVGVYYITRLNTPTVPVAPAYTPQKPPPIPLTPEGFAAAVATGIVQHRAEYAPLIKNSFSGLFSAVGGSSNVGGISSLHVVNGTLVR